MGGLLKSVEINSQSPEGRNTFPSSLPSAFHEHHMTVGQVSRDFSSVGTVGHDREDTVTFLVGKTFTLLLTGYHKMPIIRGAGVAQW